MELRRARIEEIPRIVAMIDGAIRTPEARTSALDDFPLALGERNLDDIYVVFDDGALLACLAVLVRALRTSIGAVDVAAIGSVVTRSDCRGRGLSTALQELALREVRGRAQLAVLWTDEPRYYSRRGFRPAGIEHHLHLGGWRPQVHADLNKQVRRVAASDMGAIENLFDRHPWRTLRRPGESAQLYQMPGTEGFVLEQDSAVAAYVFVGKGADFPGWAHEWGGEPQAVAVLLAVLRERGRISSVLVPQGGEELGQLLSGQRAESMCSTCGFWAVLDSDALAHRAQAAGYRGELPGSEAPASAWLGEAVPTGDLRKGVVEIAIWGFDSI